MDVVITDKELASRKSQGAVYICRICKDGGKNVMIGHHLNQRPGIVYGFCEKCIKDMSGCSSCMKK